MSNLDSVEVSEYCVFKVVALYSLLSKSWNPSHRCIAMLRETPTQFLPTLLSFRTRQSSHAAVDPQSLTSNPATIVTAQHSDAIRNLLRLADPAIGVHS